MLVDAARYSEAIWHYRRGLRYAELADDTLGRLAHLQQRICDWPALERDAPELRAALARQLRRWRRPRRRRPPLSPMHALTLPLSAGDLLLLAQLHAEAIEEAALPLR